MSMDISVNVGLCLVDQGLFVCGNGNPCGSGMVLMVGSIMVVGAMEINEMDELRCGHHRGLSCGRRWT